MTTTLRPSSPSRQEAESTGELASRFLLQNVSWETYESLLADLENSSVRLTYDNGKLELMSPLPKQGREQKLLGRLIEAYTEERNIPIAGFAQTTWRDRSEGKGLEPDECYYIRNEHLVRARDDIKIPDDPPPDLAIEVDVTHNTLNKKTICAALKIGELWNWENERLTVFAWQPNRGYLEVTVSPNLPDLPPNEVSRFMMMRHHMGDTQLIRLFRRWVQDRFTC
jgi:Uma2 family endonuclease